MSTPIKIFNYEGLGLVVSGRELYGLIAISNAKADKFYDWFKLREQKLNLVPGKDFILSYVHLPNSTSRKGSQEYTLTLETAKRIAQWQPANRGLGVLAYIREYERGKPANSADKSITEAVREQPATSTVALSTDVQQSAPKLNFDEVLPELESLGPAPTAKAVPEQLPTGSPSPVQQLLQEVQKLAEAERQREQAPNPAFADLEKRVQTIEKKLNYVVFFFQQSAHALANGSPVATSANPVASAPPTKEQTMRSKIVRLVEAWAAYHKITHQEVWQWLYNRLLLQYRFDAYAHGKNKRDPNYLDIVEEHGQLDNLFAAADGCLKLPQA